MTVSAFLKNELTRLFLFVIFCLLVAAVISPWLYETGREFASNADKSKYPGFLSKALGSMERADFARYFKRAMQLTALVFLYPFIRSMRSEHESIHPPLRVRANPKHQGYLDLLMGFVFAAGTMILFIFCTLQLGWSTLKDDTNIASALSSALTTGVIVAVIEEWLFRGVLFGILLRSLRPVPAMIGLSLFFAALHFIDKPSSFAIPITDPIPANAGVLHLAQIFEKFLHPSEFFGIFLTLFAVGMVLVYAKYRTSYLWLPIGLHAGWVFCMKCYTSLLTSTGKAPLLLFGKDVREGLLPLTFVLLSLVAVRLYLRKPSQKLQVE